MTTGLKAPTEPVLLCLALPSPLSSCKLPAQKEMSEASKRGGCREERPSESQHKGQGLPLCMPCWPPASRPPVPLWLESGFATLDPVSLQPRKPCPLCGHPLLPCQSFQRALGLRLQPLPLPAAPRPAPGYPKAFASGSQAGSLPGPTVAQARTATSLAPTPWCWPVTCVCRAGPV